MVINHKYKFLFVHIHKTAGSSIRNSLIKNIPESHYFGYDHSFLSVIPYPEIYKDYFKFAIVRNPWERLVSWYFSILNLNKENSLKQYVSSNSNNFSEFLNCTNIIYEKHSRQKTVSHNNTLLIDYPDLLYPKSISFNQIDYILDINNNIGVDYIGRFENLNSSWSYICEQIKLNIPLRNDKIGTWNNQSSKKDYREFYNEADKNKIANLYSRDIESFKYSF